MPQILMPYTVHIDHTLRVTPLNTLFAKGDTAAHRFELTILRSGVQEELTGCKVVCKFYRMAESTVVDVDGSIEDGKAVAVLNMACYDYIGRFALTIAIQNGEEKTTVFYGDGYMHGPRADTLISGEYIIYDINTLLEKISEIDAATQAANTAASNANKATANANTAATNADEKAAKADNAANGASGWANATMTAKALETGSAPTATVTTASDGHKVITVGIPRGNPGVYIGPDEPTDPTIDVWIDSDGEADELPSGVTPEEIQAAVDSYLDANPVTPGADGEDGGYYAPAVDTSGNLTWTPSKADMPAVSGANIKGPAGADGAAGADGKSAYAYAQDGGYTGSEAQFAAKLAQEMPTVLPSPHALTLTGAVSATYDGSAAVSVEIPEGGSGGGEKEWSLLGEYYLSEAYTVEITGLAGATEFFMKWSDVKNEKSSVSSMYASINGINVAGAIIPINTTATVYGWSTMKYNGLFWDSNRTNGYKNDTDVSLSASNAMAVNNAVLNVGKANTIKIYPASATWAPTTGTISIYAR